MIILKSRREIDRMRIASNIVAKVLAGLRLLVCPGVTTYELEQYASAETLKHNAKSAFRGYHNYPSSLCCSPNNQ
ncbi:MAG: M24 family metallopeptidase, partial [Desulfuromonadales bacterium]